MINRRAFITAVAAGLLIVSLSAKAQQTEPVRRIGWLWFASDPTEIHRADAHLRDLGWIEGQNLIVERRFANGRFDLLRGLAEELVRLKVEIIVAEGTVATLAAKKATSSIPIVVSRSGNPVGAGLVESLARPGANVTGTSTLSSELDLKRLQLIRELLPAARRVGELADAKNPVNRVGRSQYEQAYRSLGMQPIFVEITQASELESSIAELAHQGAQVVVVSADPLIQSNLELIGRTAQRYALPIIDSAGGKQLAEQSASYHPLASYAPLETELDRQLAVLIDKILRGAKPADLPVQQPTRFELLINLRAARVMGITIPQSVLLRADEVIQ